MNLHQMLLAGAAAFALATQAARASQPEGWYLGLGVGWSTMESADFNLDPPAGPDSGHLDFGDTAAANFAVGYKWSFPIRTELEVRYADYDGRGFHRSGFPSSSVDGGSSVTSFFGNLLYDIPLSDSVGITLGGGLGFATLDSSFNDSVGNRIHGDDTQFSWQLIAGVNVVLSDRWELGLDYRWQELGSNDNTFNNGVTRSNFHMEGPETQSVMLNLRWYTDGPARTPAPPPAPPPPPPAPPPPLTTFIVFFDFDKTDLTAEAQQVVAQAVATVKNGGFARVLITGHTDTVGSHAYNQGLSERRAASVKSAMIAGGVGSEMIATVGRGFDEPMVQTGPGIREPQNRRAVIDLGHSPNS